MFTFSQPRLAINNTKYGRASLENPSKRPQVEPRQSPDIHEQVSTNALLLLLR